MTSRRRAARAPGGASARLFVVLLEDRDELGVRGQVIGLGLERAADLETSGAARRATPRDLAIAGIVPGH
jgi:hypothetical protein